VSVRRSHRATRFALGCEPLENRQLLSVGQASLGALALSNPVAAQTQIAVPTTFFGNAPTGFMAIDIEIGTISGLSQIQISFVGGGTGILFSLGEGQVFSSSFGGGEVFSPSPSSAFSDSGPGFGAGNGSLGTSGIGSVGGNVFNASPSPTSTTTSITPLNPSLPAGKGSSSGAPVYVVPPPLAPIAVHLGSSVAPVTAQPFSSMLASQDELPTSLTQFGQSPDTEWRKLFVRPIEVRAQATPFIDFVEPFRPAAPAAAPAGEPARHGDEAPAPGAARIRPLPALSEPDVDALLDLTDRGLMSRAPDRSSSRADDRSDGADYSWNLSTVIGAAVVATGGYHLAMRESDRFNGRWVPRWVGSDRPTKRRFGFPSR